MGVFEFVVEIERWIELYFLISIITTDYTFLYV